MRRSPLIFALLIALLYLFATYFGYKTYQSNPQGLLLFTPNPNLHPPYPQNFYTPAFPFGFGLVLTAAIFVFGVVALLAFVARFLSASDIFRVRAIYISKFSLWLLLFCLPGVLLIDWLWRAFHS